MADNRKVAFNWYLNRQGPRGPQGVKGDTGFSPNISVETDTLSEYILRITNEGGYFLTSNLREHKEDRGGTYIRYDRENGTMYAGEADTATNAKAGMIKIATAEDVEAEDESTAVTPAILADYVAGAGGASIDDTTVSSSKVWSSEKTSQSIAEVSNQVATNTTDISNIKTALPNKQNKLTAGANITIEGDVISATGSGSGDVTLAGDNSFTGNNTFGGVSTFNGDTWIDSLKVGTSLKNQQDKLFLSQSSITAGNNVTIEETTDGVKISATGGGGSYTLPPATATTLGGIKVGDNLSITEDGTLSATGGGSTDSYTKSETDALLSEKNDNIFDIGKFTVVGSPTITDDGVASGFSSGNYVKSTLPFTMNNNTKKYTFKGRIVTGSDITTDYQSIFNIGETSFFFVLRGNSLTCLDGGGHTCSNAFIAKANTIYDFIIDYKIGIGCQLFVKEFSAESYTDTGLCPPTSWTGTTDINIAFGFGAYQHPFNGSIDLNSFKIYVDGKEVFNGLMSSTEPIYNKITTLNANVSNFELETSNNFSAVNSALNEKATLSDLSLKQNRLVEGNNVTLTNLADGTVRIDATGGGGSTNISATLPLKIVDDVISLDVDGQTIQIVDGKLTANIDELNNPFSLFDGKYSDHELNNLSWLKSEGQWNSKAVYTDAYDKLLKVHNGTETVVGLSVKLSTETYTDYDFVLNTAEETFRLPLLDGSEDLPSNTVLKRIDNTTLPVGTTDLFTASHNGNISIKVFSTTGGNTAMVFRNGVLVGAAGFPPNVYSQSTISFDVKRGDAVDVNLDVGTVTYNYVYSKAVGNGSLYYYVGETVQNANLIDAGRIGEELVNIKASIDGDWTYKGLTFADSFSLPINTEGTGGVFTYDLSNYLPNDGYKYEVTISVEVNNSSFCTLGYYLPDNSWYSFAKGGNPIGGCFNAIVDSSRQVKISVVNTQEALMWARAVAYRRLGKKV